MKGVGAQGFTFTSANTHTLLLGEKTCLFSYLSLSLWELDSRETFGYSISEEPILRGLSTFCPSCSITYRATSPNHGIYGRQTPLNESLIILVFNQITKTSLTLAIGTYQAKNNNDVRGKVVFRFLRKLLLMWRPINKSEGESPSAFRKTTPNLHTDNAPCCNFKSISSFFLAMLNTVLSKQTVGTVYKLYLF